MSWHIRTCHPNPQHLMLLSKIMKGLPNIKHPQDIEQCSDCFIAKLCKAARGHALGLEATSTSTAEGQGLAINDRFMVQRLKNVVWAKLLTGINSNNDYCMVYEFF
jgi:hypothetical protein